MPLETLKTLQDLETLRTLQDLEITGATGSHQDDTLHELIETDGQQPVQTLHPSAPHPALQAHPSAQLHSTPFYPSLISSFTFDTDSTLPIDPGLLDARYDHPTASGPGTGAMAGFHHGPWAPQPAPSASMDGFMASPTSLPQYNPSMPLVPGMSSFEPMVNTTWSMDGSLPSTSASSRGPTMSSSISVPGTSTPADTKSPGSPGRVSAGRTEPPAASKEASATQMGMQLEPRAEDQPKKKRRQTTGHRGAPTKTSAERRSHGNNSSPGFSTPQVPIAPAPIAPASTSDENARHLNKKEGSSSNSSRHHSRTPTTTTSPTMTTTSTASSSSSGPPPRPGPPAQPTTLAAGQTPDPRARNREAANRCRAKSKVAVAELEATERAMSGEHQALTQAARTLRDEVLSLKNELLMHGNCDDDLIQQYLANSARMVGSGAAAGMGAGVTGTGAGGLPLHPAGPSMAVPPGAGGSSSRAMLPGSSPRVPLVMPPSSSALGLETTAQRGRGRAGRKQ